jgi:hypothetical protein
MRPHHPFPSLILLAFCLTLFLAACGDEAPASATTLDPLTGLDTTKPLITPAEIAMTESLTLLPYRKDSLWGFADSSGQVVLPPAYHAVQPFKEGLAIVMRDSLYGVIDKKGREIVPLKFQNILPSACGLLTLRTAAGFVLVGIDGKRFTQEVYQKIFPSTCSEDRIPVLKDGRIAYLDRNGKNLTGFVYEEAYPFHHGVAPVKKDGKWGLLAANGKPRGNFRLEGLFPLTSGLGVGMEKDATGLERWGVIDTNGNTIIPFQFGQVTGSFQGSHVAAAARNPMDLFKQGIPDSLNTWFIFNRKGELTGETHAHLWDDFAEGLIVAEQAGKFGFVDTTGRVAIPFQYEWACGFSMGMAWVGKGGKYGFINHQGQPVIPLRYQPALDYVYMREDGALVTDPKTQTTFYINPAGKEYRPQP